MRGVYLINKELLNVLRINRVFAHHNINTLVKPKELNEILEDLFSRIEKKEFQMSTDLTSEYYQELMTIGRPHPVLLKQLKFRADLTPEKFTTTSVRRVLKSLSINPMVLTSGDRNLGLAVLSSQLAFIVSSGVNYSATIFQHVVAAGFGYNHPFFVTPKELVHLRKFIQV